jgi:hypothetical protein
MKTWLAVIVGLALCSGPLWAAGGTSTVASPGQPAYVSPSWPEGVAAIVNDPARTSGWNSWFTEWPNDVNQYGFEIKSRDDVNRLIEKLAAVKAPLRQIRLAPLKEPQGLGWVTSLPQGNGIPVIFSLGDQARIDEWYNHVRKPFGVMEFLDTPVAVPPTLTLFVQNDAIDLDQLKIPDGITVEAGYVPTVFHRANTKQEKERQEQAAAPLRVDPEAAKLAPELQAAVDKIHAFLKQRETAK